MLDVVKEEIETGARMPRDATAPAPQNANPTFTTDNSVISETHTVSLFSKQQ